MTSTTLLFTRPSTLALAVTAAIASGSTLANSNHYTELDQVVVTESRTAADTDIVIDQATLDNRQAADVADIFAQDSQITVGGSAPAAQKVYVRGLEDTLLNVTIDGATQSGYIYHHQGRLTVEPELLKQVEVSAGAGEATNGPGALGGAIRFITKDPEDLLRPGQTAGALVKAGYYSNTDGYKTSATVYGRLTDDWSALGTLVKSDQDDITDGAGNTQPYTGTEQLHGFAKIVGQLTEEQKVTLSYDRSQDEAFRLHRPHWVPSARNAPIDQQIVRETITGKYGFDAKADDAVDFDLTLYRTEASLEHIDGPYGDYLGSMNSVGGDVRNTSLLGQHELTYGIDYRQDKGRLSSPLYGTNEEQGSVVGLYLQNHYQVVDAFTLSAGARYDWFNLDEELTGNTFSESGLSPNLGFSLDVTEQLNVHGGWARAIRGTQVKELYVLDYYRNSPDRKEETADNYELGARYQVGSFYLKGEAFETHIDDVVGRVNGGSTLSNIGKLETTGFNLGVGYDWQRVSGSLSYSQANPELNGEPLQDDDMSIGTSIGDTWVARVDVRATDSIDIGWTGRLVERLIKVADGTPEKAGYGVHDLYTSWRPLSDDQLTLKFAVNNVFDKEYRDHASYGDSGAVAQGLPESGRDIRLSAAYRF